MKDDRYGFGFLFVCLQERKCSKTDSGDHCTIQNIVKFIEFNTFTE